jgi:threonine dehydrogenase-like Zn-dependent dehydrogenase
VLSLVWDGDRATPRERERPERAPDTALVRVTLAGICNTDLEIARGYMSFRGVLGHEFAGVVEEGPEPWKGQRVVGEINFACGQCPTCQRGLGRHCPSRRVMGILDADGAFAEYVAVPVANLHRIPDGLADPVAVFTEPVAAAFEILEQIELGASRRAVVLGDGKLGLLVAQVLAQAGLDVLAVGRHPDKLDILDRRGIETRLVDAWRPDAGADLVVEATGSAQGFEQAVRATRPRGTLVLKSTLAESPRVDLAPLVIHEIRLVGSRCGPFPPALAALAAGTVEVDRLVSERWPLARGDEALRRAAEPGVLKVLLECSATR